MTYAHPEILVSTDWLADNLTDPSLRIFDCSVLLSMGQDWQYSIESGRATYEAGHIPGASFLDIADDLSDPNQALRFMLPSAEQFADVMGKAGVGPDTRVILYSTNMPAWATRLWWMLRAFGFDNVAVLDGGAKKWKKEARPLSTDNAPYPANTFTANFRPHLVADKAEVEQAIGDSGVCILNALPEAIHTGEMSPYGRKGRIASSLNVPTASLEDAQTGTFLPADALQTVFEASGVWAKDRIITYCGGGIAATHDTFALALLGKDNVAVYDASMSEWATDPDTPMETSE
jgi:thiosulfate/3-mercaptopyruvate sulfurtransferase